MLELDLRVGRGPTSTGREMSRLWCSSSLNVKSCSMAHILNPKNHNDGKFFRQFQEQAFDIDANIIAFSSELLKYPIPQPMPSRSEAKMRISPVPVYCGVMMSGRSGGQRDASSSDGDGLCYCCSYKLHSIRAATQSTWRVWKRWWWCLTAWRTSRSRGWRATPTLQTMWTGPGTTDRWRSLGATGQDTRKREDYIYCSFDAFLRLQIYEIIDPNPWD